MNNKSNEEWIDWWINDFMDKKVRINETINMRKMKGWMKGRKNKGMDEWKKRRYEWKEDWKIDE